MDPVTLHVQGTGGLRFDMDVPEDGHARERFIQRIASGDLIALDGDGFAIDRIALLAELDPEHTLEVDDQDDDDGLDALTVKELRARAEERGIDLGDATKKADILEALRAGDNDEADDTDAD